MLCSGRICSNGTMLLKKPRLSSFDPPIFWEICDLFLSCDDGRYFFVMNDCETLYYDEDRFSFVVQPNQNMSIISSDELNYCIPLQSFNYNGTHHVIPNYYQLL